ncbi:MAG: polysaccharide deacetylase family protein [Ignavibacteriaceae bacterium]
MKNQFNIIKNEGYVTISFKDLIEFQEKKIRLPFKPIIITFDDGYLNSFNYLYPLLKKLQFNASIFLPISLIGKTNEWDYGEEEIIGYKEIQNIKDSHIEFCLHSYSHLNYNNLSLQEIKADIKSSIETLREYNVNFIPVIAYPYGRFPKNKLTYKKFCSTLRESGIKYGLRIGNRINRIPIKDIYNLKRIDIKGTDSIWKFKIKLKRGRIKLF